MRLVDDDEVVVAPIERFEVDVTGIAALPAEVGVGKHVVAEAVGKERIEATIGLVNGPVLPELLRAEHEDALVLQLKVFDDGEGFVGFAQANAVGDDAAVVTENFVDGTLHTILLKLEERFPYLGLKKAGLAQFGVGFAGVVQELFKNVEEGLVVDELRRVVLVELLEVLQDLLFDILDQIGIAPQLVEPLLEFLAIAIAVNDEVQLDVIVAVAQAKAAHREI